MMLEALVSVAATQKDHQSIQYVTYLLFTPPFETESERIAILVNLVVVFVGVSNNHDVYSLYSILSASFYLFGTLSDNLAECSCF